MTDPQQLIDGAAAVLRHIETLLPPVPQAPDWGCEAFRWRRGPHGGCLHGVREPHRLALDDLLCLSSQRAAVEANTRQFLAGRSANNALLWGSRGTGKSSLVKAMFTELRAQGLRLIEVAKDDLTDLSDILEQVRHRPERFILFCDDLSFGAGESGYTSLKAALDGSINSAPDNLLIYATSNRRHLLPEPQADNRGAEWVDGEIHPGEGLEERISLSDRFGLWVAFHPFSQAQYLEIVQHWLCRLGAVRPQGEAVERAALQWALRRGSRSGRTAWQFARDWAGREPGGIGA
jgi:predicted AAA+ superfamily ATPase